MSMDISAPFTNPEKSPKELCSLQQTHLTWIQPIIRCGIIDDICWRNSMKIFLKNCNIVVILLSNIPKTIKFGKWLEIAMRSGIQNRFTFQFFLGYTVKFWLSGPKILPKNCDWLKLCYRKTPKIIMHGNIDNGFSKPSSKTKPNFTLIDFNFHPFFQFIWKRTWICGTIARRRCSK